LFELPKTLELLIKTPSLKRLKHQTLFYYHFNKSQAHFYPSFWLALALYRMVQGPESSSHRHPDENQDHLKKILNQVQNDDFSNVTI